MVRACIVLVILALLAPLAGADTIALLPLDADKRLEIYGQPVAAEVGRALKAAGFDVVVVGAKASVPETAQLIVDGSIASAGGKITLSMRIRDPHNGTVLEKLPPSTTTLTTIDKAAAELSAKIVPAVKTHLAAIATKQTTPATVADKAPTDSTTAPPPSPLAPELPAIETSVAAMNQAPVVALLVSVMHDEAIAWARAHASQAAAGCSIAFEVLGLDVDPGEIPLARARVRARVTRSGLLVFNRVIVTDTIVGDRQISDHEMAARTAREVLAIANAQLRRLATGWR